MPTRCSTNGSPPRAKNTGRTHRAQTTHDAQMSRGAINEYRLYGLMPIGDTVRRGGWWYHTDIATKKRWFGEPFGGPDTHIARPYFVKNLEKNVENDDGYRQ